MHQVLVMNASNTDGQVGWQKPGGVRRLGARRKGQFVCSGRTDRAAPSGGARMAVSGPTNLLTLVRRGHRVMGCLIALSVKELVVGVVLVVVILDFEIAYKNQVSRGSSNCHALSGLLAREPWGIPSFLCRLPLCGQPP